MSSPTDRTRGHATSGRRLSASLTHRVMAAGVLLSGCHPAAVPPPAPVASQTDVPESSRGCRTPVAQRASDAGCFLTAEASLSSLGAGPIYWHLYTYPTRSAADAARGAHGTVVESFSRFWVYTIEAPAWRPSGGHRVAVLGPLTVSPGITYTARYMEAVFPPDFHTRVGGHRHSGAEAWFVLAGAQCLETPDSLIIAHAGNGAVVPAGPPMSISGYGPETRQAVLLVLHPSTELWVTPAPDWMPQGRCRR